MARIYDEARYSCVCGSEDVGPHNYKGEEYGLWECKNCGCCDYPDAFDRPKGFIDDNCSTCDKETSHSILGIDNWDGMAAFRCVECKTEGLYKIIAPREFERVVEK